MFYTFHTHRRNFIKKSADFCGLHIFEKSLDFCGKLIYYSVRYSGIVQSVEQRTVNPYVAGSSPAARAKISADFCGFFCIWSVLRFFNKNV